MPRLNKVGGIMNNKSGWFYRARRTFLQGVIGYLIVALPALFNEVSITRTALIGVGVTAVMTGVAAVMNINDGKEVSASPSENTVNTEIQEQEQQETPDTTDNEPFVEESAGEG